MPPQPAPRYTLIQTDAERQRASLADAVRAGLGSDRKSLPCRFLYDEEGSRLFEAICEQPEYYLTRVERTILVAHADDIARSLESPTTLAELGSGSSSKTRLLIEALLRAHGRLRYLPVDISPSILEESARELLNDYDALEVRAIASEYQEGLSHVRRAGGPKLIAWLGSSIGNLTRREASSFLGVVRAAMAPWDRLLVGIDLRKEARVLEAAYDDAAGVTADFTRNLLARINRELSGRFDLETFRHRARYDTDTGCVTIDLVSRRAQRVAIEALGLEVGFAEGEAIHMENAFKYSFAEIDELAARAQLSLAQRWLDPGQRFSLNLLGPVTGS